MPSLAGSTSPAPAEGKSLAASKVPAPTRGRAQDRGEFTHEVVEAEELRALSGRNQPGIQGAGDGLDAALE